MKNHGIKEMDIPTILYAHGKTFHKNFVKVTFPDDTGFRRGGTICAKTGVQTDYYFGRFKICRTKEERDLYWERRALVKKLFGLSLGA
jgi:ribosomal protein S14